MLTHKSGNAVSVWFRKSNLLASYFVRVVRIKVEGMKGNEGMNLRLIIVVCGISGHEINASWTAS